MYGAWFADFLKAPATEILGHLLQGSEGSVEATQRNAWLEQIKALKTLQFNSRT